VEELAVFEREREVGCLAAIELCVVGNLILNTRQIVEAFECLGTCDNHFPAKWPVHHSNVFVTCVAVCCSINELLQCMEASTPVEMC